MPDDILTRAAVEAWLRALPPDVEAGIPGDCAACPLARYLQVQGFLCAEVYGYDWIEFSPFGTRYHDTPAWVSEYVDAIDSEFDERAHEELPVTAAEALAVLVSLELPQEVSA